MGFTPSVDIEFSVNAISLALMIVFLSGIIAMLISKKTKFPYTPLLIFFGILVGPILHLILPDTARMLFLLHSRIWAFPGDARCRFSTENFYAQKAHAGNCAVRYPRIIDNSSCGGMVLPDGLPCAMGYRISIWSNCIRHGSRDSRAPVQSS